MTEIRTPTPGAASVTSLFATADAERASAAAAEPAAAPPEIDPEAPHGRDDTGAPLAPYGWTKPQRKDEKSRPKLTPGRSGKGDAARITDSQPAQPASKPRTQPTADRDADYSEGLAEAHNAVWLGLTSVSKLAPKIPVIGRKLPAMKIAGAACVWAASQDRLCGAVALAAKHNDSAARFAAKLSKGEVTWVLTAAAMIAPVAAQMAAVFAGDQALAQLDTSLEQLAAQNDEAMEAAIKTLMVQMEAAAQAEMAAA